MPRVVGIIQARLGSSRLPGKVLLPIAGKTALAVLLERVARARALHDLLVATSERTENDVIAEACSQWGMACFRGSEDDVLARFARAGEASGADIVVRITGDDVFMDPHVIDYMVAQFSAHVCDCATGLTTRSFPNGFVVSVFSLEALRRADAMALDGFEREHVVPALLNHRDVFSILEVTAPPAWQGYHLGFALDTARDYALIRDVMQLLGECRNTFGLADLLGLVARYPALQARARCGGNYWSDASGSPE